MSTFGERLRMLIGGKKTTIARVSEATGMNRTTISLMVNDKSGKPRRDSIEKLAEFLECNPDWLETGKGDALRVQITPSGANIPSSKRLAWLQGGMSLKDFAKKCGVEAARMAAYLEGARMADEDVYSVAKACKCSLGWLTAGEAWQGPDKPYTGFSLEWHQRTGERLYGISQYLHRLQLDLHFSYPLSGDLANAGRTASDCMKSVDKLRSELDANHWHDNNSDFSTHTYYCNERTKKLQKVSNVLDDFFVAVKSWQAEKEDGGNTLELFGFIQQFRERFPDFAAWHDAKNDIKNAQERGLEPVEAGEETER